MTNSAAKNRLAHAYLFGGPAEIGKKTLALEFAKWLLCAKIKLHPDSSLNGGTGEEKFACGQCRSCQDIAKNQHPDVFVLQPRQEEKRGVIKTLEIGIDEIKTLRHQISLFPYSASHKIAVIDQAEWLTREAANSFLKTLEEPSGKSLIILVSPAWQTLLPTIVSRCQLIRFSAVPEKEIFDKLSKEAKNIKVLNRIVKLSAGRPGRALNLLREAGSLETLQQNIEIFKKILKSDLAARFEVAQRLSQNSSLAQENLSQWLLWLRDKILENNACQDLAIKIDGVSESTLNYPQKNLINSMREIQKTKVILDNPSFNARLALEVLMMKI
ncbi:MAG: DNA polymerase III subunit delta' [Parcubacteria group bacterium LiPW_39]|nr:MAG: DNA polymerase III subunit delta' [Parcubacteria group bacterium LiPW_39]